MNIVEECEQLKSIQEFKQFIQDNFRKFLPHKMALCGVGDLKSGKVTRLINIDFPDSFISYAVQADQTIQSPLAKTWLVFRKPIILQVDDNIRELDIQFLNMIKRCKINSIASHGVVGPYGQCFSYFSFANIDNLSKAKIRTILLTFVPILHNTFSRILTQSSSIDNEEKLISAYEKTLINSKFDSMMSLTHRENEILNWMSIGKTNWEMAQILGISHNTVNNHIKSIFKRLNVNNRTQAISMLDAYGIPQIKRANFD